MRRNYKTGRNNRSSYIYYIEGGPRIEIIPGENGVDKAYIEMLHAMDDAEIDSQRRFDYHAPVHLESYMEGSGIQNDGRNNYLTDESNNPELMLIELERGMERAEMLKHLNNAMDSLMSEQRELILKKFYDGRTNTDIAAEEGVTEAAVRKRLKKALNRLAELF